MYVLSCYSYIQYDYAWQKIWFVGEHDCNENYAHVNSAHDEPWFEFRTISDPHWSTARHARPDR